MWCLREGKGMGRTGGGSSFCFCLSRIEQTVYRAVGVVLKW